jgi:hypothetical protein
MAEFDLKVLLAENKAYLVADSSLSLVNDRSFTRVWRHIPPIALEACLTDLRSRRSETDPKTDLKTFVGKYRVQNCAHKFDVKSEEGQIYETLALGLLTNIAELATNYDSSVTPDPDVRLVRVEVLPQTDTIVTSIDDIAVGNGAAQNFTGTLSGIPNKASVQFSDGTQGVWDDGKGHLKGNIDAGNNFVSYTSGDYDVTFAKIPVAKASITCSFETGADPKDAQVKLIRRWPYVDPDCTDDLIMSLRDIRTVINPIASGQMYVGRYTVGKVYAEKADDGSDDIIEEMCLNLSVNFSKYYAVNCKEDILIVEKDGLSKAALDSYLKGYQREAYAPGVHNSINIGYDKTTGLYSISVRQRSAVKVVQDAYQSEASAARTAIEDKVINDTTAAPLSMARVAGEIISGSVELNDMCRYDKVRKKITVIDQTGTDYDVSVGHQVAIATHTENTSPLSPPDVPVLGIVREISNSPTDSGKTKTASKQTAYSQLDFYESYTSEGTTKTYLHRLHAAPDVLAADMGTLNANNKNNVSGSQEDNGLLEYEINTQTPDNASDLTAWAETTHGYTALLHGAMRMFIIFTRYFATAHGAELHVGTIHTVPLAGSSDGIPAAIQAKLSDSANWVIYHNSITKKTRVIFEAIRVEMYNLPALPIPT